MSDDLYSIDDLTDALSVALQMRRELVDEFAAEETRLLTNRIEYARRRYRKLQVSVRKDGDRFTLVSDVTGAILAEDWTLDQIEVWDDKGNE